LRTLSILLLAACTSLSGCASKAWSDFWDRGVEADMRVMLSTGSERGKHRLERYRYLFPALAQYLAEQGDPDYVYVDRVASLWRSVQLLYLDRDAYVVALERRDEYDVRIRPQEPIPDHLLWLLDERDRQRMLKARAGRELEPKYATGYARRLAVVVGIDDYALFPPLEGAVSDAHAVAETLRSRQFDVIELYDREASKQRLLQLLALELPQRLGSEDLALFYFAGHGGTETLENGQRRGYLVPADARREDASASTLSMQDLRAAAEKLPAKHVLFAFDACFSGLSLTRSAPAGSEAGYVEQATSRRAVQVLTAGRAGELAHEYDGRGVFTVFLLRGIQGEADVDHDGYVTASELGAYVPSQVTRFTQALQTPTFGTLLGSGEVVFDARSSAEPPR
jgi:hypothetical protein